MDNKIQELERRTIEILEKTKKEISKYGNERKKLDKYFRESKYSKDTQEWENFLIYFEEIIKK